MILYMYIAPGQGQITSDSKISKLIYSFCYFDHFCEVSSWYSKYYAKTHFWYIDKCHNSVINYRNLPINNPKRCIVGKSAYAKFEWNPLINT